MRKRRPKTVVDEVKGAGRQAKTIVESYLEDAIDELKLVGTGLVRKLVKGNLLGSRSSSNTKQGGNEDGK